jgi:transposase
MLDSVTGEIVEQALSHESKEEVRVFYAGREGSVRVGIEASGQSQWFERMLAELGHEVWIGDAAKMRARCERKQKTDRRDAELLMRLLAEDRFPRIWVPTGSCQ